jgi:hypothetical protein
VQTEYLQEALAMTRAIALGAEFNARIGRNPKAMSDSQELCVAPEFYDTDPLLGGRKSMRISRIISLGDKKA